jgi:hypothetical protein
MMPLQKRTYEYSRLFRLIEHEMMPSASNVRPLQMRADLANLLHKCWGQARTMLSPEDQGWTGNTLPEGQRIQRGTLGVHATVDLVHPRTVW